MIDLEIIDRWQGENRRECDILGDENVKMLFIRELMQRLPIPCLHEGASPEDCERRSVLVDQKNDLDEYYKKAQQANNHLFDYVLIEIQKECIQAIAEHDRQVLEELESIVNG